jgi:hypothetical protein
MTRLERGATTGIVFDFIVEGEVFVGVRGRGRRRPVTTWTFSCTTCHIDRPARFERSQALFDRDKHRAEAHPHPHPHPQTTR